MKLATQTTSSTKVHDAFSGVNLGEVHSAIAANLNKDERLTYANAIEHAMTRRALSRGEVKVLDKVDEITMKHYGLCLKDSIVTKARLKACKKFGMQFKDRGGLIEHMNMYIKTATYRTAVQDKKGVDIKLAHLLIDRLGEEAMREFTNVTFKIMNDVKLTLDDLQLLARVEHVFNTELDATMLTNELREKVIATANELGVDFASITLH